MVLPFGSGSLRVSGSISDGIICSCSGTDQPVLGPARAEAEEHLAGDEQLARGAALLAVEVGQPLGVAVVGPLQPQALHRGLGIGIGDQRGRLDPGTDDVAGPALDRVGGVAVVAHQPARPGGDVGPGGGDQRVEVRARWAGSP